ncbi:hypothetical protein AVEN_191153-1 [Araneus ventricosus]|uniref:Uncharacterized protein n=1 Tax=Araneus ventricosus TaxID=182803 RepID=A0A4Y2AY60_ARAVE|nr:hypothetical protein AVEN_191153-1 [Araneus ventricosus]
MSDAIQNISINIKGTEGVSSERITFLRCTREDYEIVKYSLQNISKQHNCSFGTSKVQKAFLNEFKTYFHEWLFGLLVILTSRFEAREYYFGTDLVILNHGQMTTTTLGLAPPLQASMLHQREDVWPLHIACNSSVFRAWNPPTPKPRPYH